MGKKKGKGKKDQPGDVEASGEPHATTSKATPKSEEQPGPSRSMSESGVGEASAVQSQAPAPQGAADPQKGKRQKQKFKKLQPEQPQQQPQQPPPQQPPQQPPPQQPPQQQPPPQQQQPRPQGGPKQQQPPPQQHQPRPQGGPKQQQQHQPRPQGGPKQQQQQQQQHGGSQERQVFPPQKQWGPRQQQGTQQEQQQPLQQLPAQHPRQQGGPHQQQQQRPRQQGGPPPQQQGGPKGPWQPRGPPPQRGPPGYQQQPASPQGHQQPGEPRYQQQRAPQQHFQQGGTQQGTSQQRMDQPQHSGYQTPTPSGPPSEVSDTERRSQEQSPVPESLTKEMAAVSVTPLVEPQSLVKPGTKGRKILVECNHVSLNIGKIREAVHYDVAIKPDTPKGLLRQVMVQFQQMYYPNRFPAFDGRKNLYSPTMLPFGERQSGTIIVQGENRPREFEVEVKFARKVDLSPLHDMLKTKMSPLDALQCLDIVLRNAPSNTCIPAGRCFFTQPRDRILPLGEGMEMYYGFYQAAIRGWKPLLNIDVAHKAFPKCQPVIDTICELCSDYRYTMRREDLQKNGLNDNQRRTCEKYFRMLKVKYEIPDQGGTTRIHRVNGLGPLPGDAKFEDENKKVNTVANYFATTKKRRLNYLNVPTLWVGNRDRPNKILLPAEFCEVVSGQAVARKMTETQTSEMIKIAATNTTIRKQKIMTALNTASYNNDPCIREFGFSVGNQFERLDARVLTPPVLAYDNKQTTKPMKGVWRSDRNKFLKGAKIEKWTIVSAEMRPGRMDELASMIFQFAGSSGIVMREKAIPPFVRIGGRQTENDLAQYFATKKDYDLIFVVIPNAGPTYNYVKKAAELNIGCLTQCIKSKTLMKLNPQTVTNILLKVNSKMNGTNHMLAVRPPIMNRPCMLMGADVTHPSPDAKDIPSVAAVTASHDPMGFQYNICWRLQPPKVEIIEDLCSIVKEQLLYFRQKTGCKPERIVFFRDGVSEGQFGEVQRAEIRAIRQACRELQPNGDYEPPITFLVVQKRHHTRLFPTNPKDSEDRNMNVPAGTCVDTMITNPRMQDFYLVSHASIQGVAKPTKYCTIWDDNNMSHDDIEELTYHLCHMFARCNRSVSYPAPTYYAHLAAARAKVYIEHDSVNLSNLRNVQTRYQIQECIVKGKPMFFV